MPDEEKKDFVVKDRRFSAQQDAEPSEPEASAEEKPETDKAESTEKAASPSPTPESEPSDTPLPEINFATFVMSLNASALVHLGVIEEPVTGKKVKNLPMAKQTIDLLGMLEEKTKGNLDSDEANIIKNILYDLKILFVKEKD